MSEDQSLASRRALTRTPRAAAADQRLPQGIPFEFGIGEEEIDRLARRGERRLDRGTVATSPRSVDEGYNTGCRARREACQDNEDQHPEKGSLQPQTHLV